jgi:hypothetical protein
MPSTTAPIVGVRGVMDSVMLASLT